MSIMPERPKRTIIKVLVWSIIAISTTFVITYFYGGNASMSGKIALTDMIVKVILIYTYERVWNTIEWGQELF